MKMVESFDPIPHLGSWWWIFERVSSQASTRQSRANIRSIRRVLHLMDSYEHRKHRRRRQSISTHTRLTTTATEKERFQV